MILRRENNIPMTQIMQPPFSDPLEKCLVNSGAITDEDEEVAGYAMLLEEVLYDSRSKSFFESLEVETKKVAQGGEQDFDEDKAPKVELAFATDPKICIPWS